MMLPYMLTALLPLFLHIFQGVDGRYLDQLHTEEGFQKLVCFMMHREWLSLLALPSDEAVVKHAHLVMMRTLP